MTHDDEPNQSSYSSCETTSPFEFKNELIRLAEGKKRSVRAMLDAGRGNPNWIAATPREAFFLLGQFAVQESRRTRNEQDLAGQPVRIGIERRFQQFIQQNKDKSGAEFLQNIVHYGIAEFGFDPDLWIYELTDGIIGDNYPTPDRILVHVEKIIHSFLIQEMCSNDPSCGKFNLFAVEGATAAMCYIFDSLLANYLLARGDKVAIMVPIFPPYVEIPNLSRYNFEVIEIKATGTNFQGQHTWQYPDSEIEKLSDPSIKALFVVNPSNPPSVAIQPESIQQIINTVHFSNPNLMIISDDVYGTFVDHYRSLMADLSFNTIGVYSFSKYFGVTGWRLGVVALHEDNIFDKLLREQSPDQTTVLNERYSSLSREPEKIRFIDRIVADSRQVALNHTAGLSTPQQIQMALFAGFSLLDQTNKYKKLTKQICQRRMKLLYQGLGLSQPNLVYGADYYSQFDLEEWSNQYYGRKFTQYLQDKYDPQDILFRLAENSSIVLLNGCGFLGPNWSIRVSLANLDDEAYAHIGRELRKVLEEYVQEWKSLH
jgi:aspartate 4-decarboxylase